jgi:hypothetical protein
MKNAVSRHAGEVGLFWAPVPGLLMVLLVCLLGGGRTLHGATVIEQAVRVSFAPSGVALPGAGSVVVHPALRFDATRGLGWDVIPEGSFERPQLAASRPRNLLTGVNGRQLVFRVRLSSGTWQILAFTEAGLEDASSLRMTVNGQAVETGHQAFTAPATLRTEPLRIYRVTTARVESGSGDSVIAWQSPQGVQLLQLVLVPVRPARDPQSLWMEQRILEVGAVNSQEALEGITGDFLRRVDANTTDHLAAFWYEFLELMRRAEQLVSQRAWAWADRETGLDPDERFRQAVMLLDGVIAGATDEFPLLPRALLLRARLLYWMGKTSPDGPEALQAAADFERLSRLAPNDERVAMYSGRSIPWPAPVADAGSMAPTWSTAQLEALSRLRDVVRWWVRERQLSSGELGGGVSGDIALMQAAAPLLLVGDRVAREGWRRLADGVWHATSSSFGISVRPDPIELAVGNMAATAPLLALVSDDLQFQDRLRTHHQLFTDAWSVNPAPGKRLLRSSWIGSSGVDLRPPRDREHESSVRALQPSRTLAWRTRDTSFVTPLSQHAQAWAETAARMDKGKPRGVLPVSIRASDGALNGDDEFWFRSTMPARGMDWRGDGAMLDHLVFVWKLTGDNALIEPLHAAMDLVRRRAPASGSVWPAEEPPEGSVAWAGWKLGRSAAFWSAVAQWRLGTNDRRHDDLLLRFGPHYIRYRLVTDDAELVAGLEHLLETLLVNRPKLTTDVLRTGALVPPHPERHGGLDHLTAMLTGHLGGVSSAPVYIVTWEGTSESFTGLLRESSRERLLVEAFDHGEETRTVFLRIWDLQPGSYRVLIRSGLAREERVYQHARPGDRLGLDLPARTMVRVELVRQ